MVINLFLIAINWFTSPHYWWVLWVIAGWGISLLMTAIEKSIKY
ncbi:2TM domain-containing protein [Phocaeicola vulgatus]|nr:2TM domain-containing protein [Phocaeicola vulgatus]